MSNQPPEQTEPTLAPHSREAEEAVLGSILINPAAVTDASFLSPGNFYIHRNGFVFQACADLSAANSAVDFLTVSEELKRTGKLGEVGGPAYLTELINNVPSALHAEHYAKIVQDTAEQRRLLQIANTLASDVYNGKVDATGIARQLLSSAASDQRTSKRIDLAKTMDWIDFRRENQSDVWGIPTPWASLNRFTGGLHAQESILIKGDSDIGKTVFLMQLAFFAARAGYNVVIYELEMSERRLHMRELSIQTKIYEYRMNQGKITDAEYDLIKAERETIEGLPIWLDAIPGWTTGSIEADLTRKAAEGFPADLVVVDFMALLADEADTSHKRIEIASEGLRNAAKRLNFAAVSVASETKAGSLAGTKAVRYNADMICEFIQPEPDTPGREQLRRIKFDKARGGGASKKASRIKTSKVDLTFDQSFPVLYDGPPAKESESERVGGFPYDTN